MKILLCEAAADGHRRIYMENLAALPFEVFCIGPENVGVPADHYIPWDAEDKLREPKNYKKWCALIAKCVKEHGIDLVHLLDGDTVMRHMGRRLAFGKARLVITYHHFFGGLLRRISYRLMTRRATAVAHTESIVKNLKAAGVRRVKCIPYPSFEFEKTASADPKTCRAFFGIPDDTPVIGIVGALTAYKNILPFLSAMQGCTANFRILICGAESSVSAEQIEEAISPYRARVHTLLRRLTDEEYRAGIVASDIIFSLYGPEFDGASGPLIDGVCAKKMILASSHGSLGELARGSHLGYTADATSPADMQAAAERAIADCRSFSYDGAANTYRESLDPRLFAKAYQSLYESL